jgi:hypothetical protein
MPPPQLPWSTAADGAANELFVTLRSARFGEVLRGVSFTPGTGRGNRE